MRLITSFPIVIFFTYLVCSTYSYDMVFNTDRDLSQWKINGSYIYSNAIPNLAALLPMSVVRSSKENDIMRVGFWLARYIGPDDENFLTFQYSLKAHLFRQGYVRFIASPNVPLTVTTRNDQEVGKFWSDGKTWCEAIFTVNLEPELSMTWSVPDIGHYALVDKLIFGILDNLHSVSNRTAINPCLTSAPGSDSLTEDDLAPDMAHKPQPPRNRATPEQDHTPPDMVNKPARGHHHHLHGSSGGAGAPSPPDMVEKAKSPAPDLDTSTVTTEDEVQTDSSDVKCGCSCSCSRVKGRRANSSNNATMTTSAG